MATWKPAYLIHGEDHGRIAERRANLRARAEAEGGTGGVEILEGEAASPEAVGRALSAMTFAVGRRFIVVEGVERWKDDAVTRDLAPALLTLDGETTVAFFAREDGRAKAPAALIKAVQRAGGDIVVHATVSTRELPKWVLGEARRLGIELDSGAAQALVAQVGERQQRLLRELERLALEHGAGAQLGIPEVQAAAPSAEEQIWGLVDALVAGEHATALRSYLQLREQNETLARLVPLVARRVREVLAIAERLERGESPAQVKASAKGNPWAIDRRIREARGAEAETLRRALEVLAALELDTRGMAVLDEETLAVRAIAAIAA